MLLLPLPTCCLQDGINAQWQAFYFSNAKYPLKSVTINGKPLQRNEFQVDGGGCWLGAWAWVWLWLVGRQLAGGMCTCLAAT